MLAVFADQLSGSGAVFRDQYVIAETLPALFSEQFMGGLAVFRDQFWLDTGVIPPTGPTKISITMLSSGKVRLINGRIQLFKT